MYSGSPKEDVGGGDVKVSDPKVDPLELLFFDTFSHENNEEINWDLVQFPKPVYIGEIRIIPLGARVQADFPGGVRRGATNPSQFKIEFFVNDLSKPGASTFQNLGAIDYNQNGNINFECERDQLISTDGLVLRGWYTTITLAVYGNLTKTTSPEPARPDMSTVEWLQQHQQMEVVDNRGSYAPESSTPPGPTHYGSYPVQEGGIAEIEVYNRQIPRQPPYPWPQSLLWGVGHSSVPQSLEQLLEWRWEPGKKRCDRSSHAVPNHLPSHQVTNHVPSHPAANHISHTSTNHLSHQQPGESASSTAPVVNMNHIQGPTPVPASPVIQVKDEMTDIKLLTGVQAPHMLGNNNVGSWGVGHSVPQSLEQLLEWRWEPGSQFMMGQAQHFDIASLHTCLHQLRAGNISLGEEVNQLIQRRDHLLAEYARLANPLAPPVTTPTTSSSSNPQNSNTSPTSGLPR